MTKFELKQGEFTMLKLNAPSEKEAWKQINMMGIRNRSKTLDLIRLDDNYDFK